MARSSHNSTQGPTCLIQKAKRKNRSYAPEQSWRKKKRRVGEARDPSEEDVSPEKSQKINSVHQESQSEGDEPYSDSLLRGVQQGIWATLTHTNAKIIHRSINVLFSL